jgi:NADH:ubiquinone oxidoreductase subunit 2 (subunit N)
MNWADLNLMPALPELFMSGAILVILMLDAFISDAKRGMHYGLALLTLAVCAVLQVQTYSAVPVHTFSGMFVSDALSSLVKLAMYGSTAIVLVYSRQYIADRGLLRGEFFTLALFALLGMNFMVSASSFVSLYMGLELLSLSLYSLIALQRDSVKATESAMKYFVLGALASGLLLYGISMIYGATGSLDLALVAKAVKAHYRQRHAAGVWPGVHRGWLVLQAGCRTVPHVGAGRLPRLGNRRYPDGGCSAEAGCVCLRTAHPGTRPGSHGGRLAGNAGPGGRAVDGHR